MNKFRTIEKIIPPPPPQMVGDGFRVHHFFPNDNVISMERMSPFFLMDYNSKFTFSPSDNPRGVGVHPHRGFETVTIAFQGKIAHHDSAGHEGIIGEGDIQWMTAGSGVLHKEYHELEFSKQGGPFQMVQLWVNLPAAHKMTPPKYQEITASKKGIASLSHGVMEIICGEYQSIKGPAFSFSPMELYIIKLSAAGELDLELPEDYNSCALMIEGSIKTGESEEMVLQDQLVLFNNDGNTIKIKNEGPATILYLAGKPLHETIAAYGPFVMNTEQEIRQAFEDFRNGKFGFLS